MLVPLLMNNFQAAGGGGASFIGPNIADLNLTQNQLMAPIDFSGRFSGVSTFTLIGGAVTGLTLSSAGVLSGTPTTLGAFTLRQIQGDGTINSNTFTINVIVAAAGGARHGRRQAVRFIFN